MFMPIVGGWVTYLDVLLFRMLVYGCLLFEALCVRLVLIV